MLSNNAAELFDFYNAKLKRLGIAEEVETVKQLSESDRLSAAVAGTGMPLLSFWLLGRMRTRRLCTAEARPENADGFI